MRRSHGYGEIEVSEYIFLESKKVDSSVLPALLCTVQLFSPQTLYIYIVFMD